MLQSWAAVEHKSSRYVYVCRQSPSMFSENLQFPRMRTWGTPQKTNHTQISVFLNRTQWLQLDLVHRLFRQLSLLLLPSDQTPIFPLRSLKLSLKLFAAFFPCKVPKSSPWGTPKAQLSPPTLKCQHPQYPPWQLQKLYLLRQLRNAHLGRDLTGNSSIKQHKL